MYTDAYGHLLHILGTLAQTLMGLTENGVVKHYSLTFGIYIDLFAFIAGAIYQDG